MAAISPLRPACGGSTDDPELEPGEYIELSVSDTGIGMSAEVAARAFDPFYTTKGVGKGTGLGLSQVYGIARQAGGTARIESQLGQGTTIRVLLRAHGHAGRHGPSCRDGRKRGDSMPRRRCWSSTMMRMCGGF